MLCIILHLLVTVLNLKKRATGVHETLTTHHLPSVRQQTGTKKVGMQDRVTSTVPQASMAITSNLSGLSAISVAKFESNRSF